jgi:hypothetical protein
MGKVTMQFNEFSFNEGTRHLQLLHFKEKALITKLIEINHAKKSAKESIIHEASLSTIKLRMN